MFSSYPGAPDRGYAGNFGQGFPGKPGTAVSDVTRALLTASSHPSINASQTNPTETYPFLVRPFSNGVEQHFVPGEPVFIQPDDSPYGCIIANAQLLQRYAEEAKTRQDVQTALHIDSLHELSKWNFLGIINNISHKPHKVGAGPGGHIVLNVVLRGRIRMPNLWPNAQRGDRLFFNVANGHNPSLQTNRELHDKNRQELLQYMKQSDQLTSSLSNDDPDAEKKMQKMQLKLEEAVLKVRSSKAAIMSNSEILRDPDSAYVHTSVNDADGQMFVGCMNFVYGQAAGFASARIRSDQNMRALPQCEILARVD